MRPTEQLIMLVRSCVRTVFTENTFTKQAKCEPSFTVAKMWLWKITTCCMAVMCSTWFTLINMYIKYECIPLINRTNVIFCWNWINVREHSMAYVSVEPEFYPATGWCWGSWTRAAGMWVKSASRSGETLRGEGGWKLLADWLQPAYATEPFCCWTTPGGLRFEKKNNSFFIQFDWNSSFFLVTDLQICGP